MRLHIMGAPGSGKTALARSVGERFGVRVWDLDWIVYDGETGQERSPDELRRELQLVFDSADRITEGAYHEGDWLEDLLRTADLIIWLDFPWRICATRMAKRHVRLTLVRENPHPGTLRFLQFLNYTRRAKQRIDTSTSERLAPVLDKVVRCQSNAGLENAWVRLNALRSR